MIVIDGPLTQLPGTELEDEGKMKNSHFSKTLTHCARQEEEDGVSGGALKKEKL